MARAEERKLRDLTAAGKTGGAGGVVETPVLICKRKKSESSGGRTELSDFFCIICNSRNIPVNSQNSEKEEHFSCSHWYEFRYFDSFPSQMPRPILRKRTSLRWSWTGSAWTGDFCLRKLSSLPG